MARCGSRRTAESGRFSGGKLEGNSLPHDRPFLPYRFLRDRDGALRVATSGQGGSHVYRGRTDRFVSVDGLSGNSVSGLFEDREGDLWAGTGIGYGGGCPQCPICRIVAPRRCSSRGCRRPWTARHGVQVGLRSATVDRDGLPNACISLSNRAGNGKTLNVVMPCARSWRTVDS